MGRPSEFTAELADAICERLADGESLRAICGNSDMPARSTVFRWLGEHKAFQDQYARAREAQAETLFDEMLDIADDGRNDWMEKHSKDGEAVGYQLNGEAARRSALRIDARKWMLGKMQPKKYGEKLALTGADGGAIEHVVSAKGMTDDELARIASGGGEGASET